MDFPHAPTSGEFDPFSVRSTDSLLAKDTYSNHRSAEIVAFWGCVNVYSMDLQLHPNNADAEYP